MPWLCTQALQQTVVVQTHNVDHNPTMWEHPTTPFHRTNWVRGPTLFKEHSAVHVLLSCRCTIACTKAWHHRISVEFTVVRRTVLAVLGP